MEAPKYYDNQKAIHVTNGDLPHWHQDSIFTFLTFRLADSLPRHVVERMLLEWNVWKATQTGKTEEELRQTFMIQRHNNYQKYLDAGYGSCVLAAADIRKIVEQALLHYNGTRYLMHSFVIMPNHVHMLFETIGQHKWQKAVQSIKGYTGHEINQIIGKSGKLWQREGYDRLIRTEHHYNAVLNYIIKNAAYCGPIESTYWQATNTTNK